MYGQKTHRRQNLTMPVLTLFHRKPSLESVGGDVTKASVLARREKRWQAWAEQHLDGTDVTILAGVDALRISDADASGLQGLSEVSIVESHVVGEMPAVAAVDADLAWTARAHPFVNPRFTPIVGIIDTGFAEAARGSVEGALTSCSFDRDGHRVSQALDDISGHGTHVAGLVAGRDTGVAPGVPLAVANVFRDRPVTFPALMSGLSWLAGEATFDGQLEDKLGCDVLNCSWAFRSDSYHHELVSALQAVGRLGTTIVASVGDAGEGAVECPAAHDFVLGVGSHDRFSRFHAAGSAWNSGKPDLCALGVDVATVGLVGQIVKVSGTSFATAQITGAAARLLESGLVSPDRPLALSRMLNVYSRPLGYPALGGPHTSGRAEFEWLPGW